MSEKLDRLYLSALKQITKARHRSVGTGRIPAGERGLVMQRAKWQAGMKVPGKRAYVKTKIGKGKLPVVFQLTPADVKKWAKRNFDPMELEFKKIGKMVFERYHNTWHHAPVDWRGETTSVKWDSPEGEILQYGLIDVDDYSTRYKSIQPALEAAFGPPPKNDMRHYKALLAESRKVGWPLRFDEDLTKHDNRTLRHRDPSLPFGWLLRDSGTQLILPEHEFDQKTHQKPSAWIKTMEGNYNVITDHVKFYAWDGLALHKKSPSAWGEWIDAQHKKLKTEPESHFGP